MSQIMRGGSAERTCLVRIGDVLVKVAADPVAKISVEALKGTFISVYQYVSVCVCLYVYIEYVSVFFCVCLCVYIEYVSVFMCVYVCVCIVYIGICVCLYVYIYIYIYIYIHQRMCITI